MEDAERHELLVLVELEEHHVVGAVLLDPEPEHARNHLSCPLQGALARPQALPTTSHRSAGEQLRAVEIGPLGGNMKSLFLRAPWPPCRQAAVASDPRSCQPVFRPEAYICSTSTQDIRDGVGEVRSSSERSG